MSALHYALMVMGDAAPNARDFYVQGDHAYPTAAREHADRVARVAAVLAEFEAIAEDTDSQTP